MSRPQQKSRNLILSTVCALSYSQLEPFIRTARVCVPTADIIFFTSHTKAKDLDLLRAAGVKAIPFHYFQVKMRHPLSMAWPIVKMVLRFVRDPNLRVTIARPFCNLFFLRNILFYEFLLQHRNQYSGILLTDCRDVVFQDCPFQNIPSAPCVFAFLENAHATIELSEFNSSMVRSCFGERGLREVASKIPSCAGTVLGNVEGVVGYLKVFVETIPSIRRMRIKLGDDQGLHNYIVHTEKVPNLQIHKNSEGTVATVGIVPDADLVYNQSGDLINAKGQQYSVLHQYDRRATLKAKFHLPNA